MSKIIDHICDNVGGFGNRFAIFATMLILDVFVLIYYYKQVPKCEFIMTETPTWI